MPMKITRDLIESYLNCRFKGYLKLTGAQAERTSYEAIRLRDRHSVRSRAVSAIDAAHESSEVANDVTLSLDLLKRGMTHLLDARVEDETVSLCFDGLKRVPGRSLLGDFQYAPVLYIETEKPRPGRRLLLATLGRVIGELQGRLPTAGFVSRGQCLRPLRVGFTVKVQEEAGRVWRGLREQQLARGRPRLLLNSHCAECAFRESCRQEAMKSDDLSLLQGCGRRTSGGSPGRAS